MLRIGATLGLRQAGGHVDERGQPGPARCHRGFGGSRHVVTSEEEVRMRTVEHDDPQRRLGLDQIHQPLQPKIVSGSSRYTGGLLNVTRQYPPDGSLIVNWL